MKYAIYSDVDGTIYSANREIHKHNIEAVKKAQKLGIEFVITTGNAVFERMRELASKLNVRYLITSNGSGIFDIEADKYIYTNMIPEEAIKKLKDFALANNITSSGWDTKEFYTSSKDKWLFDLVSNVMMGSQPLRPLEEINGSLFKFETYDKAEKVDMIVELAESLGLQCARIRSEHVEITNGNVNKGEGVKWLNDLLGVNSNNFMTIGDTANDHSMLQITDYSYAMANADQLTKSKAKLHTSAVEQGGLGEAIDDFLYRKKIEL